MLVRAYLSIAVDVFTFWMVGFATKVKQSKLNSQLHKWKPCKCPSIDTQIHVPDCQCPDYQDISPLLQIRWKRLVVDEGHTSANIQGNLTNFAKMLSVERRWLVTGTPTSR